MKKEVFTSVDQSEHAPDNEAVSVRQSETRANTVYHVRIGAYSKKENAVSMQKKLKAAGFEASIVKEQ